MVNRVERLRQVYKYLFILLCKKKEVPKILLILLISAMFKKIIFLCFSCNEMEGFFGGGGSEHCDVIFEGV